MVGGNDEALYTVTSDKTKENKKFKCDERIIQLKSTDHKKKSFQEAVEFCHNYIDSIYSNYIAPLDDNTRIRTVIQHDEFNSAINFPFMKKKDLTSRLIFKEMDKVIQSRKQFMHYLLILIKGLQFIYNCSTCEWKRETKGRITDNKN